MPFVDLHCDTVSQLLAARRLGRTDSLRRAEGLHVDLERLQKSGYLAQNFALFVNLKGEKAPILQEAAPGDRYRLSMSARPEDPLQEVLTLADLYWTQVEKNADIAAPALSFADMEAARQAGKVACLLTVEEGGVCLGETALLRTLHRLGVRMLTLTWNYENELARPNGRKGGLTEKGVEFLGEMEELGMIPDVSHLGDDGFWDLCRLAKRPFLASHSNCRALWPHRRNLTDEMLRALAHRGGLAGLNFYAGFLGPGETARTAHLLAHLRHMINVAGLEVAALGSDFDGIDTAVELGDSGSMDRLLQALDQGGFTPREIDAITWKNAWDFYRRTL